MSSSVDQSAATSGSTETKSSLKPSHHHTRSTSSLSSGGGASTSMTSDEFLNITTDGLNDENQLFDLEELLDRLRQFPVLLLKTVTEIAGKLFSITVDLTNCVNEEERKKEGLPPFDYQEEEEDFEEDEITPFDETKSEETRQEHQETNESSISITTSTSEEQPIINNDLSTNMVGETLNDSVTTSEQKETIPVSEPARVENQESPSTSDEKTSIENTMPPVNSDNNTEPITQQTPPPVPLRKRTLHNATPPNTSLNIPPSSSTPETSVAPSSEEKPKTSPQQLQLLNLKKLPSFRLLSTDNNGPPKSPRKASIITPASTVDSFKYHPLFTPPKEFIERVESTLPKFALLNQHELGNVAEELLLLEPHLKYAYSHFVDQQLVSIKKAEQTVKCELELPDLHAARVFYRKKLNKVIAADVEKPLTSGSTSKASSTLTLPTDGTGRVEGVSSFVKNSSPNVKRLKGRSHTVMGTMNPSSAPALSASPLLSPSVARSSNEMSPTNRLSATPLGISILGFSSGMESDRSSKEYLPPRRSNADATSEGDTELDGNEEEEDEEEDNYFTNDDTGFMEQLYNMYEDTSNRIAGIISPFFRMSSVEEDACKRAVPLYPYQPEQNVKIMISVNDLVFDMIGECFEPLFASLYLYNHKKEIRVSEEFNFTLNTDAKTLKNLGIEKTFPRELINASKQKQAVFTIREMNPDIYIVLWVRRIYSDNGSSSCIDLYTSKKKLDDNGRKTAQEKMKTLYSYLDSFRAPFLCAVEPLFEEKKESTAASGSFMPIGQDSNYNGFEEFRRVSVCESTQSDNATLRTGTINFDSIFTLPHFDGKRSRFNISQLIDAQKDSISKQSKVVRVGPLSMKTVQGYFSINVESLTSELPTVELDQYLMQYHQVSPLYSTGVHGTKLISYIRKPNEDNDASSSNNSDDDLSAYTESTSVMSKAQTYHSIPRIHLHFNHVLYLFLDNCNFTSLPSACKSISVRIFLRDSDDTTSSDFLLGSSSIFSEANRTNNKTRDMKKYVVSNLTYHQRYPQFFDQIKVQLPIPITENHHIVFEFRHVSCIANKTESTTGLGKADTTVFGYSIMRLLDNGVLSSGSKRLPVYKTNTLPSNYLSDTKTKMQTYSNDKALFRFRVITKSSLYPPDDKSVSFLAKSSLFVENKKSQKGLNSYLQELNTLFSLSDQEELLKTLQKTSWVNILRHAPIYINLLLYIISNLKECQNISSNSSSNESTTVNESSSFLTGFLRKRTGTLTARSKTQETEKPQTNAMQQSLNVTTFETLIHLIRGVYRETKYGFNGTYERDTFLSTYIYYMFRNPAVTTSSSFCLLLIERWDEFFVACHKRETEKRAKETTESDDKHNESKERASKRQSIFRKSAVSSTNDNSEYVEEVTAFDSLQLSWFLFDLLIKSMRLYILEGRKDEVLTEPFYTKMRSLQTKFMERFLTTSGDPMKLSMVRVINRNLALFMCDLLDISLMEQVRDDTRFRKFIKTALNDYVLTTQFKASPTVVTLKFEFAEILIDYDMFVEVNMCSEAPFLLKFVLGILQKANKPNLRETTVSMINKLITKLDYTAKYQVPEVRNEISKLVQPFFFEIAHTDKLLRNLDTDLQSEFALSFLHCLRNRKKQEWPEHWVNKPPDVITSFIKLLSLALNNNVSCGIKTLRRSIKIVVLEVLSTFIEQRGELLIKEHEKYSPVIEEILLLFMKYIEQFNQSSNKKKLDPILTNSVMVPLYVSFTQLLMPVINVTTTDDRWKWALGTLLSVCSFPFSDPVNQSHILDGIYCLLNSHQERILNLEKIAQKLVLSEDSEKNFITENNQIKAATLDKLVEKITGDRDTDPKFRDIFFLTYRSFCTSHTLMDKLIDRFNMAEAIKKQENVETSILDANTKITLRVINAVKLWVDKYFHEFDNVLLVRLVRFLDSVSEVKEFSQFCNNLRKTLSNKLIKDNEIAAKHSKNFKTPEPILPDNYSEHVAFNLLEWSPIEFARQVTLIEYEYFQKIEPKECLSGAWSKSSKYEEATNIAHLTDRWNKMTQYVASAILSHEDIKMRRKYIVKFVEIANALRELKNFHAVTEIMSGLSNVSIHRLKKTWLTVPTETITLYEDLKKLCTQEQASKAMRQALQISPPPCIPPLSMYLKDLTFINDGNADNIRDGLINVFKRRQVSKIILEIRQYQLSPYYYETVDYLHRIINQIQTVSISDYTEYAGGKTMNPFLQSLLSLGSVKLMDEDAMWEASLAIEPRAAQ